MTPLPPGASVPVVARSFKETFRAARESLPLIGPGGAVRELLRHLLTVQYNLDRAFDRRYGVDTSAIVRHDDLGIDDEKTRRQAAIYVASPARVTRYLIRQAAAEVDLSGFAFVDFGHGKGRVMLVASEFPFQQVVGFEISDDLNEIARNNIDRYRNPRQRCHSLAARCADAREAELPPTDTVFHFYNPFSLGILTEVLENIRRSLETAPRHVLILYLGAFPQVLRVFDRFGFLRRLRHVPCLQEEYSWALYSNR